MRFLSSLRLLLFLAVISPAIPAVLGHEPPPHPAYIIAEKYLKATHLHQWDYAAKMIDNNSLENLKRFQKIHLANAPTVPEEKALLQLLGMTDISEIDTLSPQEIFIRRARANMKRMGLPTDQNAQKEESLELNTLGTAREGNDMVHTLVRVDYTMDDRAISELALVSLVKEGTVWKISLDAQEPKVLKIEGKE